MIEITNEDNLKLMSRYEDNYFDLAIVDPPYGIGNFVQQTGNKRGKEVRWNNNIPSKEYFKELQRVSKERIIWGANYYNCFNNKGGAIIWNKGVKRETNFSVCEIASYSRLKRVDYVHLKWQNIHREEQTIHPCQKPIKLYEWLLMNYAKENDKILETHLGSGSIAIACHNLGYDLTACELDTDYYEAAIKRLKQHQAQLTIF
ncbi:DNA modification methylase [Candidatus Pacearchaeota archaeon]|jgi:site-specific DNA-methyltransferase (adenine-specific)|nr:DNA modification methylase [Candidatus Pacearchaeota archaeon]|tara:strand:- start:5118 stop:5726 length:609 start_codon:yes stop_codon:yes gene_type:complete